MHPAPLHDEGRAAPTRLAHLESPIPFPGAQRVGKRTLAVLRRATFPALVVPETELLHTVIQRLSAASGLHAVIVTRGDRAVGSFSGASLQRVMSRAFSHELFLRRPVRSFLDQHPTALPELDENTDIGEACRVGLARGPEDRQEPVLVVLPSGERRALPFDRVLLEQSEALREALTAVEHQRELTDQAHRQRELLQQELVIASRKAGMAEVATGVLHNVGNVLNSVSVSIATVCDQIGASRVEGLGKAAALLQERRHDLAGFFASDPRAAQLADYLVKLADQLAAERRALVSEMTNLSGNVDHLKTIVASQQKHAVRTFAAEELCIEQIAEETLRIESASLLRHAIAVERRFASTPPLSADRHLLLQILVNLVSNAKRAIQDAARDGDGAISISTWEEQAGDQSWICLSVADNGVGIPAEDLERVFRLGFTTRGDGHGFGLHNCATTIQQMGGSIRAESDGPGRGATFTVRLPRAARLRRAA